MAEFAPGDRVRVRADHPPGHIRTPFYLRGRVGEIERVLGAFANPEELAFGRGLWGRALLDRGDLAGAIVRLTAANHQGPHFADPISFWGEALLKQGKTRDAIAKFRKADTYAPRWGRNHMLWGEALAAQGKTAEAKAQFAAAAGMDLTADERAQLNQLRSRPA